MAAVVASRTTGRSSSFPPSIRTGEDVEAVGDEPGEQLGTPAAAIEDDRHAALADEAADLLAQLGQHLDQAGVGFGRDDDSGSPAASLIQSSVVAGIAIRVRATWVLGSVRWPWSARTWPSM